MLNSMLEKITILLMILALAFLFQFLSWNGIRSFVFVSLILLILMSIKIWMDKKVK